MTEKLQEILKTKCRHFGLPDQQQCENMSESQQLWIFTCKVGDSLNTCDWKRSAGFHKCFYWFMCWERYNPSNNLQVSHPSAIVLQERREAPGAQARRWWIWDRHKDCQMERKKQREGMLMHIMAYVTYNAKSQYATLIYNTQNTLHWNMWTCQYKSH